MGKESIAAFGLDLFWGWSQTDWTAIAAQAQWAAALAAAAVAGIAWYQIAQLRAENKTGRTLTACERYDFDPILTSAVRRVKKARMSGQLVRRPTAYDADIHTIINYLDQLAVGCEEEAYDEHALRRYMHYIVTEHYKYLIESKVAARLGWKLKYYSAFDRLARKWKRLEMPRPRV